MKLNLLKKPRKFHVGKNNTPMKDFGKIYLSDDEMVFFNFLKKNNNYDFTKKKWVFYASQSIGQRVKSNNFIMYLVKNLVSGRFYLFAKHTNKSKEFKRYLKEEKLKIILKFSEKNLLKIQELFKI